nr:hypothetical protein [Tanacetum cinerariifolium]
MSIDDLYNNFKIVEQEVKGTACSNSSSQNMAFVSSPSTNSTNEVPTAYGVSTTSTQSSTTSTKSYMAEDEVPISMALMAFSDFEIESKNASKNNPNELKESPDAPLVKDRASDNKDCSVKSHVMEEKKIVVPTIAKQHEKPVRKPVKYADMYSFDRVQARCHYHQRERVVTGNNYSRVNYNNSTRKTHPNMAPRAVLMKTDLRLLNTARLVNTAHPKSTVYSARPMSRFSKSAQSTVKRLYHQRTSLTNKSIRPRPINIVRPRPVNTVRPRPVNTVRPNLAMVNVGRVQVSDGLGPQRKLISLFYVQGHPQQTASTPMDIEKPLVKYVEDDDIDVHFYRFMIGSLMYLTASRPDIMKSTTKGCQFLGSRLISWQCKKQTVVTTSTMRLNMWLWLVVVDKYSGFKIKC